MNYFEILVVTLMEQFSASRVRAERVINNLAVNYATVKGLPASNFFESHGAEFEKWFNESFASAHNHAGADLDAFWERLNQLIK